MHTPGFEVATRDHKSVLEGNIEVRRQESLLKTGALQNAIFNSAYFSSIATDEKGVIQIFNVGAERMLGYTALEAINTITPADISDPQEVIERARSLSLELETPITPGFEALVFKASRGIEDIYELTFVRKDGSRFPAIVSVTALRDADDDILGYLLIGTDNTARKQVEEAQALLDQRLRDQQFYTRSLIESNLDALMMTDPQGIISDVNQQMVALTGCTRDELIGAPSKKFFTDQSQADAAIKRVLQENKVTDYELTVRALNGVETVVSYNAATFHDRDRKLQGVFAAARDVTERKRFEHTLKVKNIELERASRMKSEFLATMSHELRTPLNAIIGFSEALMDGLLGQTSALQHECAGDIFSSGLHLLSLINDILDLSKVEAGMMALELDAVDLHTLLPNSLTVVREKAAAHNIALSLEVGADLGMPQLDIRKTKQIVYNLLSNAVKFSADGGAVTLHARRVPRRAVGHIAGRWPVHRFPLADNEYEHFVELCVGDSGIGIAEPDMATLFQAFSQIDSSLARQFEGTGLGLAMVRQLAELQGGTVAVASRAGEGSRFAVWLPLRTPVAGVRPALHGAAASAAPEAAPAFVPAGVAVQAGRSAMVVENDEQAAALLARLLAAEGFTVQRAASAEQALGMMPQQGPCLIAFAIGLPGMDGWQFLQRLREHPALARVPVVIVSGLVDASLAISGGAAAMLQQPVGRAQLHAALAGLGLQPSSERTSTVLVAEHDARAAEAIAALLPSPAYAVLRVYTGSEAIFLAQHMHPDLILLDLALPDLTGIEVADALQRHPGTACIPILVGAAAQASAPPGVFDQNRFIAEVRRALLAS